METSKIHFYGGEPFLKFDLMKQIIEYSTNQFRRTGKKFLFSVTTNGLLLNKARLKYCVDSNIELTLSIDGIKEAHEIGRGKRSFFKVERIFTYLKEYPDFPLRIVSVITPENVIYLFRSVQYLVSQGVDELALSVQYDCYWSKPALEILEYQYKKAFCYLIECKSKGNRIQFDELRPPDTLRPVFQCNPGKYRIVVTPGGFLYTCSMLIPWSKRAFEMNNLHHFDDLCLGHIDSISQEVLKKKIKLLYSKRKLYGQYFRHTSQTECRDCEYIYQCSVCPAISMIYSSDPLYIPDWVCKINKILYSIGQEHWTVMDEKVFSLS